MTHEVIASPLLGEIETGSECEMSFPFGIPGFEEMRRVVPVEIPAQRPLIYLLDAARPEVCFLALPVFVIDPRFKLTMTEDECAAIGLPGCSGSEGDPKIGEDVLCIALLVPSGRTVRANLGCPLVVNLRNLRGIQCTPPDGYSNCFTLSPEGEWVATC
jgi:flagellar assembly factor FliW